MTTRKIFEDSVVPIPVQHGTTTFHGMIVNSAASAPKDDVMEVQFSFGDTDSYQTDLEKSVAEGKVIAPRDLYEKYRPASSDVDNLKRWLTANGFSITSASKDNTSIYAEAKISDIQKALEVKMAPVVRDGVTYTSALDAPSLPADVANGVRAILGLQPFLRANKHFKKVPPHLGNRATRLVDDGKPDGPAPNIANKPPYLVNEMLNAYNGHGLELTGEGQTIAILIDTFPNGHDLAAFWKKNDIPASLSNIELINVKGSHLAPPEGEETLDVSWASGVAPKAKIRIYASGTLSFVDLDKALDRIIADLEDHPEMRQLSISLGLGEAYMGGKDGEVAVQHQKFLRLAAAGVNVFISSGDAGSNPDQSGHSSGSLTQAEYGASDSCVIGVGGTSLELNLDGTVSRETAWSGSGGGISQFFPRPSWQTGDDLPGGTMRLVPDVCLAADPNFGAYLVLHGTTTQIGGTSWSAPVWAGICALANESRKKAGKVPLAFLPPLLYPLRGSSCFRDIQSGDNGVYSAGTGYDLVTGIGSPKVRELIGALGNH